MTTKTAAKPYVNRFAEELLKLDKSATNYGTVEMLQRLSSELGYKMSEWRLNGILRGQKSLRPAVEAGRREWKSSDIERLVAHIEKIDHKKRPAAKKLSIDKQAKLDPRKPAWTLLTFADLEAWRAKHGIPKKHLAHYLGVTNSTWHNWNRGKICAVLATQRRMKEMISKDPSTELLAAAQKKVGKEARGSGYMAGWMENNALPQSHHAYWYDQREKVGRVLDQATVKLEVVRDIVVAWVGKNSCTPTTVVDVIKKVREALA